MGEEDLREVMLGRNDISLECPLRPLILEVPFILLSMRWTIVLRQGGLPGERSLNKPSAWMMGGWERRRGGGSMWEEYLAGLRQPKISGGGWYEFGVGAAGMEDQSS